MSLPFGVPLFAAAIAGLLPSPLVFFRSRAIGLFVANVTLEEHHIDELSVTDHPVERNATISDHAFKRPEQVSIRVGYSNSSIEANGDPNYVQGVYRQFLALQESRIPFEIITGKRFYTNMVITRLSTTTDEKTENSLFLQVECREVIIVDTQVVTVSQPSVQKDPATTAGISNEGTKQVVNAPSTFNATAFSQTVPNMAPGFSFFQVPVSPTPTGSFASMGMTPLGRAGGLF